VTEAAARSLATPAYPLGYVLNVRLADPAAAGAFADRFDPGGYRDNTGDPYVIPWQMIGAQDGLLVKAEQGILLVGAWLLALLAVASLAVLVGARMADQVRRVGLLKAAGGTPALVAGVLLAEHAAVAVAAAAAGLVIGRLAAPLLTSPGASLLGTAGAPRLTAVTIAEVLLVSLCVAVAATFVPAMRAARMSTVGALADAPRPPRRRAGSSPCCSPTPRWRSRSSAGPPGRAARTCSTWGSPRGPRGWTRCCSSSRSCSARWPR
jgi:ABC-type lipoprotein release transport system permease subunit